jgi:hypothetical protein
LFFGKKLVSGKLKRMAQQPDFLKRHTLFSSISLLFLFEVVGHALWLRGLIPDNNAGGKVFTFICHWRGLR